ncbi:MAG: toll/interleukin-1 receptor domain-containing protein [Thermoguttaceae bacterium]
MADSASESRSHRRPQIAAGWTFRDMPDHQTLAYHCQLCERYAHLGSFDLLELCGEWRRLAEGFTGDACAAGRHGAHIIHDPTIDAVTRLLETACAARGLPNIDRLGRCLRRPDEGHLHYALALLDDLEARLRAEVIATKAAPGEIAEAQGLPLRYPMVPGSSGLMSPSAPSCEHGGLTRLEINKLVNRYIGVNGGYLGDFTYQSHRDFYVDLNLDIDPYEYSGTTRERFIKILSESPPDIQARILQGILDRYPVGSSELRTKERYEEIAAWIARGKRTAGVGEPAAEIRRSVARRHNQPLRRGAEVNDLWHMAGAERTGEYVVVLRTRLGRVGYRDLVDSCRIRVEPEPAGRTQLDRLLTRSRKWKQPGDDGQDRYSIVVPTEQLPDLLRSAVRALNPRERGAEVNPSVSEWIKQMVREESQRPVRNQVFFSYSHKDKKWLERFQTMLKPVMRGDMLWDDTKIAPGAKWKEEIRNSLASAKVAVLLVSKDFLASDFIRKHEFPPLLKAEEEEGLVILWVPLGFSMYQGTEIADYQAAHDPNRPLDSLKGPSRDKALVAICEKIRAAADKPPSSYGA